MAASEEELIAFFERERYLLQVERDEEIKRSALILSGCSARLLEVRGLALIGLGVVGINIGLGGKR
jgi:DNA polymerase alpha-associated DNA helicase A